MMRVGILGLGFMGSMHFRCYKTFKDVTIAAICEIDKNKFKAANGTAGNIPGSEGLKRSRHNGTGSPDR